MTDPTPPAAEPTPESGPPVGSVSEPAAPGAVPEPVLEAAAERATDPAAEPPPAAPQVSEAVPDPAAAERPTGDGRVGIETGGDVTIGGHVVGRDMISTSHTGVGTQTIDTMNVGWSERAVIRLALVVGIMVFITAACFFSGGLAVGGLVYQSFVDRPLTPLPEQADAFQQQLDALDSVQSGETFTLVLSEDELNAFVHYRLGPQIGFTPGSGEARLINDNGMNQIAVRGDYEPLGGLPVIATFQLTDAPGAPLQLTGASARLFGGRNGGLGWVLVPVDWLRTVETQVNALLGNVQLSQAVVPPGAPDGASWEVTGQVR